MKLKELTRRDFVKAGLLASGNLVVGCTLLPRKNNSDREPANLNKNTNSYGSALHAWIVISTNHQIHLMVDRTEMGQGVFTSHAMMVAEELEVDLKDIQIHFAPQNKMEFWNPAFGMNATGGSTSTAVAWFPLRKAAAGVRELLLEVAAQEFKVSPSDCILQKSMVINKNTQQGYYLGDLVAKASQLPFPINPKLKEKKDFKIIGQPLARIDLLEKVTGQAKYGIDTQIEAMLNCYVVRCPVFGGKPKTFDASQVLNQKGVHSVVKTCFGVAVVADTFWRAQIAAKQLKVEWNYGPYEKRSSDEFHSSQIKAMDSFGLIVNGSSEEEPSGLKATYQVPYLPHSQLEPLNCTVRLSEELCEIWSGSQIPAAAIEVAKNASGYREKQIVFNHCFIGGSFGRRIHHDFLLEAVEIAKTLPKGIAVKNTWDREAEFQHDFYRPASLHMLQGTASENPQGVKKINNWYHKIVAPSIFAYSSMEMIQVLLPKFVPEKLGKFVGKFAQWVLKGKTLIHDPTSVEGAKIIAYFPDNMRVEYTHHKPALPIGFWRSVGYGPNSFAVECFIDELARSVKADPMDFRIDHLRTATNKGEIQIRKDIEKVMQKFHNNNKEAPIEIFDNPALREPDPKRSLALMEVLKEKSKWGQKMPARVHRGIAQSFCFGSYCGLVIDIWIDKNQVKLYQIHAVVDCGQVVNPDLARGQIEGGIIFGLSAALKQEITFKNGVVDQTNFLQCDILRMFETPPIKVHFVENNYEPSGIGELGVPCVAPALCNAILAATGKSVRKLPIRL